MKEYTITINYVESENGISVQMNTDGLSPYTLIGVFEHFVDRIKERLENPNNTITFPDQIN